MRTRVVTFVGTRPEVIKMAPVIRALSARPHRFEQVVVATGQHREMLDQALEAFGIGADVDLELMHPDQGLDEFAARALTVIGGLLGKLQPDLALVQGDTTTVMMTSLAAFYRGIPFGHIEAGLRSGSLRSPFPEELNRRVTALAADLHFAPTARARENLLREGVPDGRVHVTGNTVVDALLTLQLPDTFADARLREIDFDQGHRTVLVTAHRRESQGEPLQRIFRSLRMLVDRFDDVQFVFPVHLNPRVRRDAYTELDGTGRVHLLEPLSYPDLVLALSRSDFVMTDSGGIQEEAPSWRKPVLVLRDVTERPELIEAGMGELVGTDTNAVVAAASRLLTDGDCMRTMCSGQNPFGDGRAGERIVDILEART